QSAAAGGTASFANSGTYSVVASANASASGTASAHAGALGLVQNTPGGSRVVANDGAFNVSAVAFATGSTGAGYASALGYQVKSGNALSGGGTAVAMDFTNNGSFVVAASA